MDRGAAISKCDRQLSEYARSFGTLITPQSGTVLHHELCQRSRESFRHLQFRDGEPDGLAADLRLLWLVSKRVPLF